MPEDLLELPTRVMERKRQCAVLLLHFPLLVRLSLCLRIRRDAPWALPSYMNVIGFGPGM
jgi:hypothetical protein